MRVIHRLGPVQESIRSAARPNDETEGGEAPAFEPVIHRFVHEHPESARRLLNVSPAFIQAIECLAEDESRALIEDLVAFATCDDFVHMHRWDVGDLFIRDDLRTMHRATGTRRKDTRRMHRTALAPGVASEATVSRAH